MARELPQRERPWWERIDLDIPEKVPDDLVTVEACTRYVRRLCRELAGFEQQYEALRPKAEAEGDEVALVQARKALDRVTDTTADLIFQVTERMARLASEA